MQQSIKNAILIVLVCLLAGCTVAHRTWLPDSDKVEIIVLDPVYDPDQQAFFYSKQLQNVIYQITAKSTEGPIQVINTDWLINHQKILQVWKTLDENQKEISLNFDNQSIYEQLEPFELFKTDRILLMRILSDKSDDNRLILDGYRLVKIFEDAVDINYFKVHLSKRKIVDEMSTAVSELLTSMKYATPDFLSLGFEKVNGSCYRNKSGIENCSDDFFMARYPVTEQQWQLIMEGGETNKDPLQPKTNITWDQIQIFLERLNDITNGTYSLPSITQWETACLKLKNQSNGNFLGKNNVDKWQGIAPVNAFSLEDSNIADLPGNTWEWTADTYVDQSQNLVSQWIGYLGNPTKKVLKGGSFDSFSQSDNCFLEMKLKPAISMVDIGFRLVWEP